MEESAESILCEALAYIEQGLVSVEEEDKDVASAMIKMANELVREAEKLSEVKSTEIYQTVVDSLSRLEIAFNGLESISLKKTSQLGSPPSGEPGSSSANKNAKSSVLDADLLYWLPEGVQLVMIEDGNTASPSPPTSLAIFVVESPPEKLKKEKESLYPDLSAAADTRALLQVGPWVYPLNTETSTILKNELGIYVVPNPTPDHPNLFVGIILPRDIEKHLEEEFLEVLEKYAVVRHSHIVEEMTAEQKNRTSEKIAQFLIKSGQRFARGVQKAADRSGEYIAGRGEEYRSKMTPTDKPVNVNPVVRNGVFVVYKGSKAFAKVTRYVLDKVGEIGVNIGKKMANGMGGSGEGSRIVTSTATVIGGGITGASVMWIALEDASRQLFRNFADETVEVVKVKYGEPASETSRHALHAAGHTTLSAFQIWDLGPRSIAGRLARHAGIQFVQGLSKSEDAELKKKPL